MNHHHHGPHPGRTGPTRTGWAWLIIETASRAYLAFTLALLVIAAGPSLTTNWQGHIIRSGSMEPHINVGDVVLTSPLPNTSPVPIGRVVVFHPADPADPTEGGAVTRGPVNTAPTETTLVMHRIVATHEDGGYTTAGDANTNVDSTPLVREQITGQGRLLIPWVGLPTRWINTGAFTQLTAWLTLTTTAITILALSPPTPNKPNRPGTGLTSAASPTATASPSNGSRRHARLPAS